MRLELHLDAEVLKQLALVAELAIRVPPARLPEIATGIAAALVQYATAHERQARQPTLPDTVQRARTLAVQAQKVLALLDDHPGEPDSAVPPHVPVPGWLIADPAGPLLGAEAVAAEKLGEVVSPETLALALDSGEARGDMARDAMLTEAGMRLNALSPFGAHDVARVAVAALRQLVILADRAAKRNAMVRKKPNQDAFAPALFTVLAGAFETLFDRQYTVSNKFQVTSHSKRTDRPSGPAIIWSRALLVHAAERSAGTPLAQALDKLASRYGRGDDGRGDDGLAERIRQTRPESIRGRKPRGIYRLS